MKWVIEADEEKAKRLIEYLEANKKVLDGIFLLDERAGLIGNHLFWLLRAKRKERKSCTILFTPEIKKSRLFSKAKELKIDFSE